MRRLIISFILGILTLCCNVSNPVPPSSIAIEKQEQDGFTPSASTQTTPETFSTPATPTVVPLHEQKQPPAPSLTATPSLPISRSESQPVAPVPTTTPSLPIPPVPQTYIEYRGGLYPGRLSSYCWPMSANSSVCTGGVAWQEFDKAPAVRMNRGDGFKIVITGADHSPDPELTRFAVLTVVETEPLLRLGEQIYSIDVDGNVHVPDLPEGIYFAAISLKYHVGDVSHGFKVEIVH